MSEHAVEHAHIEHEVKFKHPITESQALKLLKQIANATGSRFSLYIESSYTGEPRKPVAKTNNYARGSFRRDNLKLERDLQLEFRFEYPDDYKPGFGSIELNEPCGWRGGAPTSQDRKKLQEYLSQLVSAIEKY